MSDDRIEGRLMDGGPPLDSIDTALPDEWSESGRGIALAQAALDDLAYARVGHGNEWTMTRRRR